ncbi:hypothetical protein ACFLU5_08985 [Bacteroidota bacterium]
MRFKCFLLTLTLILVVVVSISAQTKKGYRTIGGLGSISGNFKYNSFYLDIHPMMGWFVKDNFLLGGALNFNYHFHNYSDLHYYRSYGFNFGPECRYYLRDKKLKFFGSLSSYLGNYWRETDDTSENDNFSLHISAGIGMAYFITDQVGLEIKTGYSTPNLIQSDSWSKYMGISAGFQVHLPGRRELKSSSNE